MYLFVYPHPCFGFFLFRLFAFEENAKNQKSHRSPMISMVPGEGIEPPTNGLQNRYLPCSFV